MQTGERHKAERNKKRRGHARIQIESSSGRRETKPDRKKNQTGRQKSGDFTV
jgi:hypothetical protein